MQRSGSQKVLLVYSIIAIVVAVLAIFTGAATTLLGNVVAGEIAADVSSETGMNLTTSQVGALASLGGLLILFYGIFDLILGILGIRAANDNQKIMPVWVFALIGLVLGAIGFIGMVIGGNLNASNALNQILGIVISALIFWVANNIKTQAGK